MAFQEAAEECGSATWGALSQFVLVLRQRRRTRVLLPCALLLLTVDRR
jgi:hypothetical protein